jgi:hypothetical protein
MNPIVTVVGPITSICHESNVKQTRIMTTTQQDLLDFSNELTHKTQGHFDELTKDYEFAITKWLARTEEAWLCCLPDDGYDIYNLGCLDQAAVLRPLNTTTSSTTLNTILIPAKIFSYLRLKLYIRFGQGQILFYWRICAVYVRVQNSNHDRFSRQFS